MKKIFVLILLIIFFSIFPVLFSQAQNTETLTIATYYPSPHGVYQELRAQRMAIGDNYYDSTHCWPPAACTTQIDANTDLVVEGNVGIGTPNPETLSAPLSGIYKLVVSDNPDTRGFTQFIPSTIAITNPDGNGGSKLQLLNPGTNTNWSISARGTAGTPANPGLWTAAGTGQGGVFAIGQETLGLTRLVVVPNGNVGVGTILPQAVLDVNGGVRVGVAGDCSDTTTGCNSSTKGTMRYCDPQMQYCNGSAWSALGESVKKICALVQSKGDRWASYTSVPSTWTITNCRNYAAFVGVGNGVGTTYYVSHYRIGCMFSDGTYSLSPRTCTGASTYTGGTSTCPSCTSGTAVTATLPSPNCGW